MAGALAGQAALVTGAGSPGGIGFATARRLLEAGAAVAITATTARIEDRAQELAGLGRANVMARIADLTDSAAADALAAAVVAQFGRLDILVNGAGMAQTGVEMPWKPLAETDPALWRRMLAITLDTAFYMTRAVLPRMRAPPAKLSIGRLFLRHPVPHRRQPRGDQRLQAPEVAVTDAVLFELQHGVEQIFSA